MWLSGHFLWRPTSPPSGAGRGLVQLVGALETCTHGREQTGLLGSKAEERAPVRPLPVHVCAYACGEGSEGQVGESSVPLETVRREE